MQNKYKVGNKIIVNDGDPIDGPHTSNGVVTEVHDDHIICDVEGTSDHCWFDEDTEHLITKVGQ